MAPGDPPTSRERTNEGNADSAVKHSFRLATRTKNISIENQGRIEVLLEIVQKWQGIVDLPAVPDSKDKVESHTVGAICKTVAPPCQSRIRKHQFLGSTTSRSSNKNAVSLIAVLKKASEIPSTTKSQRSNVQMRGNQGGENA